MSGMSYPETPVDVEKLNGNPISTGQGNTDAGTQRVVLPNDQPAIPVTATPNFAKHQDTFTASGNGTMIDKSVAPVNQFAIQVKGTGATPTAWVIVLEASLDGINFDTVLEHTNSLGDGRVMWTGDLHSPGLYFRSRVVSLSLGTATNVVVTVLGMN